MKYNPKIHHRRSIRLKGYDYSQAGLYFITLCVQNRTSIFGKINNGKLTLNSFGILAKEEWERTADLRKNISLGEFIIMPNHFHAIIQIDYQIKKEEDNIGAFKSPSQNIGAIIRGFKGATTKNIKELIRNNNNNNSTGELQFAPTQFAPTQFVPTQFVPTQFAPTQEGFTSTKLDLSKSIWQRNYYEHIIRNDKSFNTISEYIKNNPKKWADDKFYSNKLSRGKTTRH